MNRRLYSTGIDPIFEKSVRKLFSVKLPNREMDSTAIHFAMPGSKALLNLAPAAALAGAAVWDDGRQRAATFEPCFKFIELGPGGKKFDFSAVMSLEK